MGYEERIQTATDVELSYMLTRSRREAERSFAEIYRRYSARVYTYCVRVLGSTEEAGDVFQDTMTRCFKSIQSGQANAVENLGGYLMQIARNLCLNAKRDRKITIDIWNVAIADTPISYERQELISLMNEAISRLDIKHREVFVMKEYEGMSYQEIADLTGESIPALKNRLWRAKEKVREMLSPYIQELRNLQ